jgi:hypothetical protein
MMGCVHFCNTSFLGPSSFDTTVDDFHGNSAIWRFLLGAHVHKVLRCLRFVFEEDALVWQSHTVHWLSDVTDLTAFSSLCYR